MPNEGTGTSSSHVPAPRTCSAMKAQCRTRGSCCSSSAVPYSCRAAAGPSGTHSVSGWSSVPPSRASSSTRACMAPAADDRTTAGTVTLLD